MPAPEIRPRPFANRWVVTIESPNGQVYHYLSDPEKVDTATDPVIEILGGDKLKTVVKGMWDMRNEENPNA